jgi:hypothetical protein
MNNGEQFFNTAAGGGYSISRSLRFSSADSSFLSRTPASAGNRKTWTFAFWAKRSTLGTLQFILATPNGANNTQIYFDGDSLVLYDLNSSVGVYSIPVFRDPSAWYHFVIAVDTTQATASNRVKIHVNGSAVSYTGSITQNLDLDINHTVAHNIGARPGDGYYFNGYLADCFLIDGQALDCTAFGEFSATTGVWVPKAYTGSYGTNGFHLDFADNASTTTIGYDAAGSNDWTANNLSVTAGAGNDSLVDVPANGAETDTGAGGEVRGNYCLNNPLDNGGVTLANGNLDVSFGTAARSARATFGMSSGKWYWEATTTNTFSNHVGIAKSGMSLTNYPGADANGWSHGLNGYKYNSGAGTLYGSSFSVGDVIGTAFDADAGTLTFYKNGVSEGTAFTGLTSGPYFPVVGTNGTGGALSFNFGQRPFAYFAPSGFKALNTANLPAPVVTKPSDLFDVKLYTGNGSTQTISGLGFSPDLVWGKARTINYFNTLQDTVRGAGKTILYSNSAAAENAFNQDWISSFTSDGFSMPSGFYNESPQSYVAWAWDAGSSTVTNTQGSISSQVRANASAGFSVVTFTAQSSGGATIGHGLGVAPSFIIVKSRVAAYDWAIYHASLGNTKALIFTTAAANTSSAWWSNTSPTSSVFSLDAAYAGAGNSVAYCFAPVAGYSAMGSWQNNGSNDGTFVYLGFRPKFILLKNTDNIERWYIMDSSRHTYNVPPADATKLQPNLSDAEGTGLANTATIDFLSNGFKIRTTNTASGEISFGTRNYIYAAFAEAPFQYARAR